MRLINVHSLELEEFFDEYIPKYVILSHTWTKNELSYQNWQTIRRFEALPTQQREEPPDSCASFQKNQALSLQRTTGYAKIARCCQRAIYDGFRYIWVDTCCIDKTSSAELSEAINSMYHWYGEANMCYAYLADVQGEKNESFWKEENTEKYIQDENSAFRRSRWFTRGWTLQELLAPRTVLFFDANWNFIAAKHEMLGLLSDITGIKWNYLYNENQLKEASISERMSWASKRKTTRKEDIAYCLLGIFGVNMPLLYGEGDRAFTRLQEEIMKESTDQTILAWGYETHLDGELNDLLAPSPRYFIHGHLVHPSTNGPSPSFQMTNKGLQIRLRLYVYPDASGNCIYAALDCRNNRNKRLWLPPLIAPRN